MANPLFGGPMGQMMQVISTYQNLKAHPEQIGKFLYDKKVINDDQLSSVDGFNGDASQIGNYLINNSIMSQADALGLAQQAPQVQKQCNCKGGHCK